MSQPPNENQDHYFTAQRAEMVNKQLRKRGIRNRSVLHAMGTVPREAFVPKSLHEYAYADRPLPIGCKQTISQPFVVAVMLSGLELEPTDRVLEVGTGSGYAAALLGQIVQEVYTVERHDALAENAARQLAALGYSHVHVKQGDGTLGWAEHAPFNAILVSCGGPFVPPSLKDQLAINGRLLMPVGGRDGKQKLVRVIRIAPNQYRQKSHGAVSFVPIIGAEGWDPANAADD